MHRGPVKKAEVVREALRLALEYEWGNVSFYSCNALQTATFHLFRGKCVDYSYAHEAVPFVADLQAEYAALFDDATFWVETRPGRPCTLCDHTAQYERNFDRACCLMMFAEIVE